AAAHDLACRGHNLLWYWRTPKWFGELDDRSAARTALLQRIAELAGRYRGRIDSWDVVNEPGEPAHGRAHKPPPEVFLRQIGPEYLRLAHLAAREADPAAKLILNECGIEYDTQEMDRKRAAVLDVLADLREQGIPLDGLGVQAHLSAGRHPFSENKLR